MGLFGFGKKNQTPETPSQSVSTAPVTPTTPVTPAPSMPGLLNLNKGDILDLTKVASSLEHMRVAAGWDVVVRGRDYDLDLCAYLVDKHGRILETVYYGSKNHQGISLDKDNLTGKGDGDDETITCNLNHVNSDAERIVFAVVIYQAKSKGQEFSKVKNAYVRLIDDSAGGKEVLRYTMTEDGGNNTAITVAELNRNNGAWTFRAIGEYSKDTIESLKNKI